MSEKLKNHLVKKAEEYPNLKLLQSQWSFDEELIPKALQNISVVFPHYSRHDASHSKQILINIERLLGENIDLLTATDTWLLMEAAYWHDIGMLVTADDIERDMQSEAFKQYLNEISTQNGHELCSFAKQFSTLNIKNCFSAAETPHQAISFYHQLLAGWYRIRHPQRAAEIIDDPWGKAGISSPRNELVPRRLFLLLGQICRMHGNSFETILETLPLYETGMATENCHPRFIACLLRLGDLFDLDNNRFCPVMLRVAGEIPPSSQAHIDKHMAVRHFRLDQNRIEITAECNNYEGYEVTDQWFRWIEDELRKQMTHWIDIVPSRQFGLLPTLGKLEVNLAYPNEILNPGQRPRFGVDPEKTMELLQGAGIYRDQWQSIRELLQNAIDVSLMRIWLTHKENPDSPVKDIDWSSPLAPGISKIFSEYKIQIKIQKLTSIQPNVARWQLEIRDRGIGISKEDLKYMKSVGGSSKNYSRKAIISRMPQWMRPSGAFGIGLQSAFLISQEVNFESKSILTGDSLKIKMSSPLGSQKGFIFIQRNPQTPGKDFGTTLSLVTETASIPQRVTLDGKDSFTESVLNDYDPIRMTDMQYDAARMVDEILRFSEFSPIPVELIFNGKLFQMPKKNENISTFQKYFDKNSGIMIHDLLLTVDAYRHISNIAFRGQNISKYQPILSFAAFEADILCELTQDILTIDRNDVKKTAQLHIEQLLVDSICNYISNAEGTFTKDEEIFASALLHYYNKEDLRPSLKGKWLNMILPPLSASINDLCGKDEFIINLVDFQTRSLKENEFANLLTIDPDVTFQPYFKLLLNHWNELNGSLQLARSTEIIPHNVLIFTKNHSNPFTEEYLKSSLINLLKNSFCGRFTCPVWNDYSKLAANTENLAWCRSISTYHHQFKNFVLPFFYDRNKNKITTDGFDELCNWTAENCIDKSIKEPEIRELYKRFITWIDDVIMSESNEWKILRGIITDESAGAD